jgi:hypothetical protein
MTSPSFCTGGESTSHVSDERVDDDGVWSDGPLWNDFGHRAAVLGMVYSRVKGVLPFLLETANDLGLVVFDWAGPSIYGPKWKRLRQSVQKPVVRLGLIGTWECFCSPVSVGL